MLDQLQRLEEKKESIRVGVVGVGSMGLGVALQIQQAPGMRLAFLADLSRPALLAAEEALGLESRAVPMGIDPLLVMGEVEGFDVLVEASNSIAPAFRYCEKAMELGAHVVLMNAEVDLAFGPLLQQIAATREVVCTSDAGDQHGVLKTMIDEIRLWGIDIVQAGNIKGFLDRYATAEGLREEAAKRHLDPVQCCAYTDGTKLNIEMALVANATGCLPTRRGMTGPRCSDVHEALGLFDLEGTPAEGSVDYILGAEPGGGVYVIGRCDHPLQRRYLDYYKMGNGPFYLFFRPYHLCHLETTRAVAQAALHGQAVLRLQGRPITDVYAHAKRDLRRGESIVHGIGGDHCYGLIDGVELGSAQRLVPVWLLEGEGDKTPVLAAEVARDEPLTLDDLSFPDTDLHRLWQRQEGLLAGSSFTSGSTDG